MNSLDNHLDRFVDRLRALLIRGAATYGDASFTRPAPELVDEVQQELKDVCGWSRLLADGSRRPSSKSRRAICDPGTHQHALRSDAPAGLAHTPLGKQTRDVRRPSTDPDRNDNNPITNMTEDTNHYLLPRHIDDDDMDMLHVYLEMRSRNPGLTDEAIAIEISSEFFNESDDYKLVIPDWMQHFARLHIAVCDCARRDEKDRLQNHPDEIQQQIEFLIDLLHKTQSDAAESRYRQSKALLRQMTPRPIR